MAAVMAPVFTSPVLLTVKTKLFVLPVVAAVCPVGGKTDSLAGFCTVAVMEVTLVTSPALGRSSRSPVLTPAVAELKVKPKEQLAPTASAPAAATGHGGGGRVHLDVASGRTDRAGQPVGWWR